MNKMVTKTLTNDMWEVLTAFLEEQVNNGIKYDSMSDSEIEDMTTILRALREVE